MYDLLIKGGQVIDPARGLNAALDVAVTAGRFAKIDASIPVPEAKEVIDASDKIVAPGLIDLHAHVFRQDHVVDADELSGVRAGVTSIVDAGSAGAPDFSNFLETVIRPCHSRIYSFLYNHWWPDGSEPDDALENDRHIEVDGIIELAAAYPDIVKGVKVAVMPPITRKYGLEPVVRGREAARAAGLRLMLHIGDIGAPHLDATPPEVTSQALDLLDPGDILTHVFSPLTGGGLDAEGRVLPALQAARDRGVVMDAAMGDYQFSWAAAETVLAEGILPHVISSDIEIHSGLAAAPGTMVKDRRVTGARVASELTLVEYMAFFLELGFALEDVIRMTTSAPASAAGIDAVAGSLVEGRPADISVLEVLTGRFTLTDVTGVSRLGERAIVPSVTVKDGQVFPAGRGAHPWGFAPPPTAN
jgi:dihydroorotase